MKHKLTKFNFEYKKYFEKVNLLFVIFIILYNDEKIIFTVDLIILSMYYIIT